MKLDGESYPRCLISSMQRLETLFIRVIRSFAGITIISLGLRFCLLTFSVIHDKILHIESRENRLRSLVIENHLGLLSWQNAQTGILRHVLFLSMVKTFCDDVLKRMFCSSDLWPQTTSTSFTKKKMSKEVCYRKTKIMQHQAQPLHHCRLNESL